MLFELRAGHMRQHAGEVAFPGGKVDEVRLPFSLLSQRFPPQRAMHGVTLG